jgi:hypothetical protein
MPTITIKAVMRLGRIALGATIFSSRTQLRPSGAYSMAACPSWIAAARCQSPFAAAGSLPDLRAQIRARLLVQALTD